MLFFLSAFFIVQLSHRHVANNGTPVWPWSTLTHSYSYGSLSGSLLAAFPSLTLLTSWIQSPLGQMTNNSFLLGRCVSKGWGTDPTQCLYLLEQQQPGRLLVYISHCNFLNKTKPPYLQLKARAYSALHLRHFVNDDNSIDVNNCAHF